MKEKYYEDESENAAFERYVDAVTNLILKYGPALKRKLETDAMSAGRQTDIPWKTSICKRMCDYHRRFAKVC